MLTKEEVLNKAGEICEKHSYNLIESSRVKFAEKFIQQFPDGNLEDQSTLNALEFALSSSFHFSSAALAKEAGVWKTKESEYQSQIEKLKGAPTPTPPDPKPTELPKEILEKLAKIDAIEKREM